MSESTPLLVMIGPPGAGKSEAGKRAAKLLRVPFVDTDRRIVEAHGDIPTIFDEQGEEGFRSLERREVQKALTEAGVVAVGGGAVLDARTQSELSTLRVVYLTVSPDAVSHRIGGATRPLLKNGMEAWRAIMDERRNIYERLATRTIDSSHRSAQSIGRELAEWVKQEENV